jgi:hypothetical protein
MDARGKRRAGGGEIRSVGNGGGGSAGLFDMAVINEGVIPKVIVIHVVTGIHYVVITVVEDGGIESVLLNVNGERKGC